MSEASEVSKPFECTSPGCKATFTNEDHLSSHQKRHEMSLLLPGGITISRSNSLTLGADLTPTPTRFIRIGEEVGLFQDLLKANPFDEQFRKAAEQNKAASVSLPLPFSGACDEPLNTPHIVHPGEGDHHPAKGSVTPAVETPQPRLASPHRLGSPPPAHVVVTPCSPLRARGGAPPAHRDPLDPDGTIGIDDDMEVEGPLDMRSPSVIPPVSETLISPPVIHTPGSLSSPPVLHAPGSLAASLQGSPAGSLAASLGSPHSVQAPGSSGVGSPPAGHTPTTLQSSAVSSTVAIPRHHQLAVPPPLRPRLVSSGAGPVQMSTALPIVHSGAHSAAIAGSLANSLAGSHAATYSAAHSVAHSAHSGMLPVAHSHSLHPGMHSGMLSGALQGSLPAAHQASSQPAGPPPHPTASLAEHSALSSEAVEFQIKLSDGQRLRRSLQRQERPPAPVPTPTSQPSPSDVLPPAPTPRTSQSEDSLRKERNRAAANRWRARKKRAQQQMASSMEALNCRVNELQQENAELRAKLKLVLGQHRDCDVSRGLKAPADTDGLSRLELDDLTRLMGAEAPVPSGAGLVSPPEEVRRVARPAGAVPTASVAGVTSSVPLVFSSGAAVPTLPVASGATHQLILLQPAPAGGQRLQQSAQRPPPLRQYRLPAASVAGRASLQPPLAHGERM
ncbi:cyclic AMP-responsive element-binding protein 5-like isoform X3 [Amphibalanus amphitrite]|uniref:cyclic AMP-responsive element-binding protein 5-like isoform X3 n=1 Tax=Amphibalanus amphitrite TaxID=1232801 RepID=UPI001C92B519|nr:cyclic AMP-responsive element-binding protein 5-like isoform X3 [Amphibalanus amphitrite]